MFYFKKVITPFVLPPGIFIVSLIAVGAWQLCRRRPRSGAVFLGLGLAIWLCALTPVAQLFIRGLEKNYPIPDTVGGDVIILLGGGINDRVPDMSGSGAPADGMLARVVTAVRLYRRLNLPIIISGGQVYPTVSPEAPIVRRFLVDLGVAPHLIIIENRSRDTYENAVFTLNLCRKYGFTRPLLVTTAFHMPRAVMLFNKAGLDVTPYPAGFKIPFQSRYGWQDWLPSAGAMELMAHSMHEYLGILYYRLLL